MFIMSIFARGRRAWVPLLFLIFASNAQAQTGEKSGQSQEAASQEPKTDQQPPQPTPGDEITAVPNRPTFASTAEMIPKGVVEVEYGFEAAEGHQNFNGLIKWGAVKNLEVWLPNIPLERDAGVAGVGDFGAGFKYKILERAKWPTIAVLYIATLPTARPALGLGALGHSAQLLLSRDFGKHHFDFNEGVQFLGRNGPSGFDRNYFTALSYSRPLTEKWGYTAEIAGFSRTNATTPATMTLLGAFTYNWSSRLVLDGGAYVAPYGALPRITFFGGVTYTVADFYHLHPRHPLPRH